MSKRKHQQTNAPRRTLRDMPFKQLVASLPELREARREYASKSPKKRRAAAQWAYDSAMAQDLFSRALAGAGMDDSMDPGFDAGVVALAIDPLFAPALLTVGSWEYQFGRPGAAMDLFMTLVTLPQTEQDLVEIIDKAGSFLLDENDIPNAIQLYRAASEAYPDVCEHWSNLSYCLGESGELYEAVSTARKALSLKEDDPMVLNDLGWTLVLAGLHEEARLVLERAVALAPDDYDLPRNNLRELDIRLHAQRRKNRIKQ
jgi:tetratricopeptide (TPR) repeat protein